MKKLYICILSLPLLLTVGCVTTDAVNDLAGGEPALVQADNNGATLGINPIQLAQKAQGKSFMQAISAVGNWIYDNSGKLASGAAAGVGVYKIGDKNHWWGSRGDVNNSGNSNAQTSSKDKSNKIGQTVSAGDNSTVNQTINNYFNSPQPLIAQ